MNHKITNGVVTGEVLSSSAENTEIRFVVKNQSCRNEISVNADCLVDLETAISRARQWITMNSQSDYVNGKNQIGDRQPHFELNLDQIL